MLKALKLYPIFAILTLLILFGYKSATSPKIWESQYVRLLPKGQVKYLPDSKGNIIPDFSRVGYHHGNLPIPTVKVAVKISPKGEEHDERTIQQAIDQVAQLAPDRNGIRGAVLLKKGIYKVPGTINITASGIVLRGEGNATRIIATGNNQRSLIKVSGSGKPVEVPETRQSISDSFVPVGAFSFSVTNAAIYKPGDDIILFIPGSQAWINDLKMNKIDAVTNTKQWQPEEYDLSFQRKITKIEGNKVFIDNPVMMEIDKKYSTAAIFKYTFSGRIQETGIENMYLESEFDGEEDEQHGWTAVQFSNVENGWIRNITAAHFGFAAVSLGAQAKNITVTDSKCLKPKSMVTGSRRYSFNNDGQQNLFINLLSTEGRHDFVTGARTLGPNVFVNGTASKSNNDIGPHHRWSVGTLYDNITTDGDINIQDRGNWGTGHGWAGVTQVLWNCKARKVAVQNPWVSGNNYCIGLISEKYSGRLAGRNDGLWEGHNQAGLSPASLFHAQLKARRLTF